MAPPWLWPSVASCGSSRSSGSSIESGLATHGVRVTVSRRSDVRDERFFLPGFFLRAVFARARLERLEDFFFFAALRAFSRVTLSVGVHAPFSTFSLVG